MCWIDREPPKMNKVYKHVPPHYYIKKYKDAPIKGELVNQIALKFKIRKIMGW